MQTLLRDAAKATRAWHTMLAFAALISFHGAHLLLAQQTIPAFDATHMQRPTDLGGLWLVHGGDDPAFARPGFDDSHWTAFDPHTSLTDIFRGSHPEIVWYRQTVRVDPAQTELALREQTLARAFEIYVNGDLLMRNGRVAPYTAYTYDAPVLRAIPVRQIQTGTLLIAARVHISAGEWSGASPGLFADNLTLGEETVLYQEDWLTAIGENLLPRLDSLLDVCVGLVALALFAAQRRHYEYFWIFAQGMIRLAELPFQLALPFTNSAVGWRFAFACLLIATPYVTVAIYFAFVNLRIGRKFAIFLAIAGVLNGYSNLRDLVPNLPGSYQLLTNLPFAALLGFAVPFILAIHWRRGNREAGILMIPAMLFGLYIYANYTLALLVGVPAWSHAAQRGLTLIQRFPLGPFVLSLNNVSGILSTVSLAVIMVLRSGKTSRRQALLEGELEAAREVQQVMLPEEIEGIPGFTIESAYEPAQQVGGDFFQIVPTGDGGLLLVLGDVAGKGLPAAMLVSVLVGATRTAAAYSHAPEEILAQLNERLVGRARGGFSTALAAHISSRGVVTIANAGHLSPYMDGRELELPGALPLGIASGARYAAMRFELKPGSRLIFYSDGVVEARNAAGEMLGFERSRELSTQRASEIAQAAKEFGQSDDITVVAIARSLEIEAAA